jgi:glutamyl-tRNA reductase
MGFFVVGINHRTAPVDIRERLAFDDEEIPSALAWLVDKHAITEALIVSTCNRVEILATGTELRASRERVIEYLGEARGVDRTSLEEHIYTRYEQDAIHHIFRVASSLDSMVVGEPQILGQVREAYRMGVDAGPVGRHLSSLLQSAFATAKRVRTETAVGANAVSVSFVAVELGRKIFGSLKGKTALLVGAGEMAELAAQHLVDAGEARLLVANRTMARGQELAERFGADAVPFESLGERLAESDVVLVSTGAEGYVVTRDDVQRALSQRRHRPLCLIDISVPRQIDPAAAGLDNVFLFDMDDLQRVAESNLREREREATLAETIVEDEVMKYLARLRASDIGPTVAELKGRLNEVALGEYERLRRKLGALTPEQETAIKDLLLPSIINKISHPMITHMRDAAARDAAPEESVSIWRRIFRLGGSDED